MRRNLLGLCCVGMVLCLSFMACNKKKENEKIPTVQNQQEQEENWVKLENTENIEKRAFLASGKVLTNLTKVGTDDTYYCNAEENLSNGKMAIESHLVCKDPVYDITYYVNYGRDYYIYASHSGVTEVAVEIPAKDLFCREGELYFIVDSYSTYILDGMGQGNILKYNPINGTVEIVVDKYALSMRVYPDAINYEKRLQLNVDENTQGNLSTQAYSSTTCKYIFETGENKSLLGGRLSINRWKDKGIEDLLTPLTASELQLHGYEADEGMMRVGGWAVVDSTGEHLVEVQNSGGRNYRIYDEGMYYLKYISEEEKTALMEFNCETGENRQVVKFDIHGGELTMSDFIILDDVVYFGTSYRYSLKEGKLTMLKCSDREWDVLVDALYTDGEELFGVDDGKLWKIQIEKAEEEDIRVIEVNGVPVVYGEYTYSLLAP